MSAFEKCKTCPTPSACASHSCCITDYEANLPPMDSDPLRTALNQRDEARRIAEAYRSVWEKVSDAIDEAPNHDPLPWNAD